MVGYCISSSILQDRRCYYIVGMYWSLSQSLLRRAGERKVGGVRALRGLWTLNEARYVRTSETGLRIININDINLAKPSIVNLQPGPLCSALYWHCCLSVDGKNIDLGLPNEC